MQQERPKPEATAQAAEGTVEHAHGNGAGQAPDGNGQPDGTMREGAQCACEDENDFDYMVTPFPEHISKYLFFNSLYLPWILLSVALAVIRVSAMAICGEETGRFALNIAYSLLPGILAVLIVAYSKQTERTTIVFCGMADKSKRAEIIKAYEHLVRRAFSNLGMMGMGLVFLALFWPTLKDRQLYPTPSHNIKHRAMLRDRTIVTVGKTWETVPGNSEVDGGKGAGKQTKVTTLGWIELPLGKVLRLAEEERRIQKEDKEAKPDRYSDITLPPQETYDPLPPEPSFDEDIDEASYGEKLRIDPEWNIHSRQLKRLVDENDKKGTEDRKKESLKEKNDRELKSLEEEKAKWVKRRADQLPGFLSFFYQRMKPAERWRLSQATYEMAMLPLLFMSGAMFWCLCGITWLTWSLGRGRKGEKQNIWQTLEIGVHPCPSRSVRDVGKNLWFVAVITGGMYTVIVICMFFARADTLSLTISSLFSLLVVTIFIVPQLNMHRLMVRAKYRKMTILNTELNAALDDLQYNQDTESIEKANAILKLQKALGDCCEWPYDFNSLAMVVGSVIIPVLMAIITLYQHFK